MKMFLNDKTSDSASVEKKFLFLRNYYGEFNVDPKSFLSVDRQIEDYLRHFFPLFHPWKDEYLKFFPEIQTDCSIKSVCIPFTEFEEKREFCMKGKTYSVTYAILSMYPHLWYSDFWFGGNEDAFLAFFLTDKPTPVGCYYNGKFYGISVCRSQLNKIFGPGDFWDQLEWFCDPATGAQKNFLSALCTVVQTPDVTVEVSGPKKDTSSLTGLSLSTILCRIPEGRQLTYEESSKLSLFLRQMSSDFILTRRLARRVVSSITICGSKYCIDLYGYVLKVNRTDSFEQDAIRISQAIEGSGHRLNYQDQFKKQSQDIIIVGSKFGEKSGLWLEDFARLISDMGFSNKILAYDQFEDPVVKKIGSVILERRRELFNGQVHSKILVDDAQWDGKLMDYKIKGRYNFKKRGYVPFCHSELRQFAYYQPCLSRNFYTLCQCLRCRSVSYFASLTGGYPMFQRVQSELAKFGPVCVREKMEMYRADNYMLDGSVSKKIKAEKNLGIFDTRVDGVEVISTSHVPKWVKIDLINRRVGLFSNYSLSGVPHSCSQPYEVIVTDRSSIVREFGFPPCIFSPMPLNIQGYSLVKSDRSWYKYARSRMKREPIELRV